MQNVDMQEPCSVVQQPSKSVVSRLAGGVHRVLPRPYHVLRMMRHRVRVRQLKRVLRVVVAKHGLMVQAGPFKGMLYVQSVVESSLAVPRALGSALVPKLLGCYEAELQSLLAQILETTYEEVVDIGAAEGYYAVGLALCLPSARVFAFETDALRRKLCAEMARANGVAERVSLAGECGLKELALQAQRQPLIVCDCEGYELELLQPDLIPDLRGCDLLVELHDSANPLISKTIFARFAPTHEATLIQSVENNPADYPILGPLNADDQRFAVNEERPEGMQWVFLKSKRAD